MCKQSKCCHDFLPGVHQRQLGKQDSASGFGPKQTPNQTRRTFPVGVPVRNGHWPVRETRVPGMRAPDQDYFCSNPPQWREQAGSGAQISPSLHTFTKDCCELGPRVYNINSCDDPRHHLAFLDTSNTKHAASTSVHEATQMEKPLEWMKVKRNQAGTGRAHLPGARSFLHCVKVDVGQDESEDSPHTVSRSSFTTQQLTELEKEFHYSRYLRRARSAGGDRERAAAP